ncbi:biotin--[acetyl-CoA-carboxylase] ligase [Fructilactobacillus vespulae]|uniref:biotin--[acetyl-CoA-carboxylase] ligase n=1 Tax=Fructilactobacillus vespulae TaxID=1249630 RepID=UPI0039B69D03
MKSTEITNKIWQPLNECLIFASIDSTMNYAQTRNWSGFNLVLAEKQTQGKGQHGHSFMSPATGIYETIILPVTERFLQQPGMLTLGIGVCVRQAIQNVLGVNTQLKWVNDLYLNAKKCGGILVEVQSNPQNEPENFVLGIGLNLVNNSKLAEVQATSLSDNDDLKEDLIAEIYNLIVAMYQNPDQEKIVTEYENHLIWKNQVVSVLVAGKLITGKIVGLTSDFRLILVDRDNKYYRLTTDQSQHLRIKTD